ncbi:MAG: hypothetical protein DRI23_05575 [Candidatus Cloacimonadota bacterium]|nr:MAG: hypothetical protein DRI23_05575 [Candidatus Cloacimonadota bacterium]RLC51997.1 MAG: hypothetical protein DRH79_05415 [Candidatus Cloacimonadota bacterium]
MNKKENTKPNINKVLNFFFSRSTKLLISIIIGSFSLASLNSFEIIKIENPSSEFMHRYEQNKKDRPEEYQWNPLQVSNHWQYTSYTGGIINTIISSDTTFNDTVYYKRIFHNGNFEFERNTEEATYCRDIYNYDEDPLTTELMWDSLASEAPYNYFSYHNPWGTSSLWETIVMEKYLAYLPLFEDSVMIANLVRYGGTTGCEEYWAEGYGLLLFIAGGGHSALTAANIDGIQYGNFVDVEEITIPFNSGSINSLTNYPNPFNPLTTISFELQNNVENVIVEIFNIKGQKIKTLYAFPNGSLGTSSVVWDGTNNFRRPVTSGVYLYKVKADVCESKFSKMILLK